MSENYQSNLVANDQGAELTPPGTTWRRLLVLADKIELD